MRIQVRVSSLVLLLLLCASALWVATILHEMMEIGARMEKSGEW